MSNKSRYFGDFWKHRSSINCHQVDRLVGEIIAKYPFHLFGDKPGVQQIVRLRTPNFQIESGPDFPGPGE